MISSLCVPVSAWTTGLSLSSENRSMNLVIGSENNATDEFDAGYDIPLPPPPPSSSFDAYIVGSGLFDLLQKDIRKNQTWTIYTKSKGTIDVTWDNSPVPLKMDIGETSFNLNHSDKYSVGPGEYSLTIQRINDNFSNPAGNSEHTNVQETLVSAINPVVSAYAGEVTSQVPQTGLTKEGTGSTIKAANPADGQKIIPSGSTPAEPIKSGNYSTGQSSQETKSSATETTTPLQKSPGFELGITLTGLGMWMIKRRNWKT
jgi:hypothetical protein